MDLGSSGRQIEKKNKTIFRSEISHACSNWLLLEKYSGIINHVVKWAMNLKTVSCPDLHSQNLFILSRRDPKKKESMSFVLVFREAQAASTREVLFAEYDT